jgi:hypothetical protein
MSSEKIDKLLEIILVDEIREIVGKDFSKWI